MEQLGQSASPGKRYILAKLLQCTGFHLGCSKTRLSCSRECMEGMHQTHSENSGCKWLNRQWEYNAVHLREADQGISCLREQETCVDPFQNHDIDSCSRYLSRYSQEECQNA